MLGWRDHAVFTSSDGGQRVRSWSPHVFGFSSLSQGLGPPASKAGKAGSHLELVLSHRAGGKQGHREDRELGVGEGDGLPRDRDGHRKQKLLLLEHLLEV